MRRTLIAVLFLVLVINYVDRASCQTNSTNSTSGTNNTTGTNSTTNTTNNTTANNTTGTNATTNNTNTTGGAQTTNTSTQTTTVNNITFFKSNGSAIAGVNQYTKQTITKGKSLYLYLDKLTFATQPGATVYVLPNDVGSVYSGGFPLKLTVITQPTAASGTASLVGTATYDGNALMVAAPITADSYLMAQIDNLDTTTDYTVLVNFNTNTYVNLLSPMGTVMKKKTGVTTASLQTPGYWDMYEVYVPSANVKVLMRLFSCVGSSQMYYTATSADALNLNKTTSLQQSYVIPNNTLEVTFAAATTVYILVNPYAATTQSDGTLSYTYTLDVSMYNSTITVPFSNFVPGGNGYISYTRNSDQSVQFSWSGIASASSDYQLSAATITYNVFVATSQDNFTALLNCGPIGSASTDGVSSFSYNTTSTSQAVPLNPSNLYYVGVVGAVTNYAFTTYQANIPALYAVYSPTSYNYVKPSSSDSNPAGLGVTVFFLVLLIIIVIILAIVLYTKYKAKKGAEMGGASMGNRAAATTTAAATSSKAGAKATSPPQSAMPVLPKNQPELPKKAEPKYAPPPVPEPTPAIRVDQLKDDHGLQQVDHHYEVEQQVPDNYDYNPGQGEYQGEEYQGGGNQDDYNPDAYAAPEQEHHGHEHHGHEHDQEHNQEYEVPADQHEVSPDNDHQHYEH